MSSKIFYKGFSTANWIKKKTFKLNNLDLVKADLLNHIWTEVGERCMMPNFGTRIPTLCFEQNDAITRKIVEDDLKTVFDYDPRVKLLSLNVSSLPNNNAIIALADLLYIEFNVTDVLHIEVPTA